VFHFDLAEADKVKYTTYMLSKENQVYLNKRRKLASYWPATALVILLLLISLVVWLLINTPFLINPWYVFESFKVDQVDTDIMVISTLILPIISLLLILVIAFMVVLGFLIFRNEKCYLAIIDELNNAKN